MKIKRRDFLKTVGMFGAGLVMYNPVLNAFAKSAGANKTAAADGWVSTTCQGCTSWCPAQVYVQGGRAIKVRGNPNSKYNPGKVCPRGHLIPQMVYDPDRLKVPLKRTATTKGKGIDPKFVPITWDEAMDTIADKILALRTADETHKYMLLRGRYTYSNDLIYGAMTKIIGSPNGISHSAICAEVEKNAAYYTEGKHHYRDYDLANTKCLVCWGVDPFRSNRQVPVVMDKWATMKKNGLKLIAIDPLLTTTGSKADMWVPIKPGEDGALASAIAHYFLVNGLWERGFVGDFNGTGATAFVENTTVLEADFTDSPHAGGLVKWWNTELKDKTTAWAAGKTGISQADIEKMADMMAEGGSSTAVWYGPTMTPRGTYTAMTLNALNGLLGSVDNYGGTLASPSLKTGTHYNGNPSYSSYEDTVAKNGLAQKKIDQRGTEKFPALTEGKSGGGVVTNNVPNAMIAKDPYDIKVAIGYRCNFAFSGTETSRWHTALAALPFFAHVTTHASEMSQFADILIPASMEGVENWSWLKTHGNLYSEISLQQPLITKLFDTVAAENEFTFLLAEHLKAKGFSNLHDYYTTEFKEPETSAKATNKEEFAEFATKFFTYPAWDTSTGGIGWTKFKEKGVKSVGPDAKKKRWYGKFGTKTKKFEFYSETLKAALESHATKHSKTVDEILTVCNYEAQGELAFVPHYESPKRFGSTSAYPYDFVDCKSRFNREGRSQNVPGYYQFKKLDPGDNNWGDSIRINPEDAASLGIADGDKVKVTNSNGGTLTTSAKLWEGIRKGCVAKSYGGGHWAYGRYASDYANLKESTASGNNNDVLIDDYDRLSGSTARNGGFVGVKIEKV